MGTTKTDIYTDDHNRLASLFKALGHPARIAILQYIISQKACICNDLVEELGLTSYYFPAFKGVKEYRYYTGSIEGKSVCYCIDEKIWSKKFQKELNTFFNQEVKLISAVRHFLIIIIVILRYKRCFKP